MSNKSAFLQLFEIQCVFRTNYIATRISGAASIMASSVGMLVWASNHTVGLLSTAVFSLAIMCAVIPLLIALFYVAFNGKKFIYRVCFRKAVTEYLDFRGETG